MYRDPEFDLPNIDVFTRFRGCEWQLVGRNGVNDKVTRENYVEICYDVFMERLNEGHKWFLKSLKASLDEYQRKEYEKKFGQLDENYKTDFERYDEMPWRFFLQKIFMLEDFGEDIFV